ncbi:hypothetical protein CLIB1423_26S00628 [[Candida] railenensis]|uniref:Alcohol acetyltransferase n=1 Tax=[Candida] railenensis TaxID=45579 RepID=A0A9P0QTM1_9ASCO|nr:hypothetical protein CLIB1423_26S00628 [[Candida] railenensis]
MIASRVPGYYERHFICRNQEKYYTNFNIVAKYNKNFTQELLARALTSFISKTPVASLNFFRNEGSSREDDELYQGKNFTVRHVEPFKFNDVVTYVKVAQFDEKVFDHVNKLMCPVNIELPTWRIIVFEVEEGKEKSQYICVYFEHAVFDGQAGVQFHKDLLDELDNSEKNSAHVINNENANPELFANGREKEVPIAAEELSDLFEPSLYDKVTTILGSYVPHSVKDLYFKWTTKKSGHIRNFQYKQTTTDLSTHYNLVNISVADLKAILAFCKSNKIALTSYLAIIGNATLANTFYKEIGQDNENAVEWSTSLLTAANGRKHLPQVDGADETYFQYGCLVTGHISTLPQIYPQTELIPLMQDFHESLHSSVDSKQCFKRIGLYPYLNIWEMYRNKIGSHDRFTKQISNLGLVTETGKQSNWKFENAWFGGNTGLAYNFVFNVTSTRENGLNIVVCCRPEFAELMSKSDSKHVIDKFVQLYEEKLVNYCKQK